MGYRLCPTSQRRDELDQHAHFQRFVAAAPGADAFRRPQPPFWPDVTFEAQQRGWRRRRAPRRPQMGEGFRRGHARARRRHVARAARRCRDPGDDRLRAEHPRIRPAAAVAVARRPAAAHSHDRQRVSQLHPADRRGWRRTPRAGHARGRGAVRQFRRRALPPQSRRGGHDLVFVSQVFFNSG